MSRLPGYSTERRFWLKVYQRGDCWEWRGSRHAQGYGHFRFSGRTEKAHRVAWMLAHGRPIPLGYELHHLCTHEWCVRPSHLDLLTCREHVRRGNNAAARFARAERCIQGHVFDWFRWNGVQMVRACRKCRNARQRRYENRRRLVEDRRRQ